MKARAKNLARRFAFSLLRITLLLTVSIAVLRQFFYPVAWGSDIAFAALTDDRLDGARPMMSWRNRLMMNWYLGEVEDETGVDINLVFVKLKGKRTVEQFAAEEASDRGLGRRSGLNGLLIVYDRSSERLRLEVGYGLEGYFSDAFIGRLIEDHARVFFRSGDVSTGLQLMVRVIQNRIRDELLGGTFDPTPFARPGEEFVSGGAGADGETRLVNEGFTAFRENRAAAQADPRASQRFVPQPSPAATYDKYMEWLTTRPRNPNVPLFTPRSQSYLSDAPFTEPYYDFILDLVWNEQYKIAERDNFAMLYFTSTPLNSPMFLRRSPAGWQIDIVEEVYNSMEIAGAGYTWSMKGVGESAVRFADLFVQLGPVIRVRDGDNRQLPRIRLAKS